MAHLKIRLVEGVVCFYLGTRLVQEHARLQVKLEDAWVSGTFYLRRHPVGPRLIIPNPPPSLVENLVDLTERSELRWERTRRFARGGRARKPSVVAGGRQQSAPRSTRTSAAASRTT